MERVPRSFLDGLVPLLFWIIFAIVGGYEAKM